MTGELEICQYLGTMHWEEGIDGLQFYDQATADI